MAPTRLDYATLSFSVYSSIYVLHWDSVIGLEKLKSLKFETLNISDSVTEHHTRRMHTRIPPPLPNCFLSSNLNKFLSFVAFLSETLLILCCYYLRTESVSSSECVPAPFFFVLFSSCSSSGWGVGGWEFLLDATDGRGKKKKRGAWKRDPLLEDCITSLVHVPSSFPSNIRFSGEPAEFGARLLQQA